MRRHRSPGHRSHEARLNGAKSCEVGTMRIATITARRSCTAREMARGALWELGLRRREG